MERQQNGQSVASAAKVTATDTTAAVNCVIGDVDRIIGALGGVLMERQQNGQSVASAAKLTATDTTAAVNRVIGDVDRIIGAHRFTPKACP